MLFYPKTCFSLYLPNFGDNKTALQKIKENRVERNGVIGACSKVMVGYDRNRGGNGDTSERYPSNGHPFTKIPI